MKYFRDILSRMSGRSVQMTRHVLLSLLAKGISVLCSLMIVPLTMNYVNPSQYGIWLTLSSIVGWIAFFDLGLANGFRNKFAEAKALGNHVLAREFVSTTYFAIGVVGGFCLLVFVSFNHFLDWPAILHVDPTLGWELRQVFAILCVFFCVALVANTFATLLTANQQPGFASLINCIGQVFSLLAIYILTKTSEGSLLNLSLFFAGIPCIVMLICSLVAFCFTGYRQYAPSVQMVRPDLVRVIIGKGIQFFAIYLCMIMIFQVSNIVLSRELGTVSVTQYNIANKYFSVLYMVIIIIITPLWSSFTDAYTSRDYAWMKMTVSRMERMWGFAVLITALMLAFSSVFYRIWIKDSVSIPFSLSAVMGIYILAQSLGNIYMYMINGIGTIRIQLIIYAMAALVAWPCLVWSCRLLGVYGVVLFPALVFFVQAFFGKIQISKLLSDNATGLWSK